ncbi:hypothetical protein QJQ45_009470 [Haematococcus lacustris]|nr:hypothetical protein QJQ45_009470 [Haematococcus lacustris]
MAHWWHGATGDTPMDIQAALAAGAKAVGVTTGIYSREELLAAAPPVAPAPIRSATGGGLFEQFGFPVKTVCDDHGKPGQPADGTPPGALLVLDSLEDTSAVLKAFGLDK